MYSKEKLNMLAYLGIKNKHCDFEFEEKTFKVRGKKYFFYDDELFGGSIYSITNIYNKRASVYFVIDNGRGNEDDVIEITTSYKKALKVYNEFKDIIKSEWSTDEELKRKQLWFEELEAYEIESSIYGSIKVAYDPNIEKFIFITFSNYEGEGYSYGINEYLTHEEMFDTDGSEINYEYGFDHIKDVIKYLKDIDFCLEDWKEKELYEFALSSNAIENA
ncbi:hypothetical protein [Sulfurimonas sp. NWX367]|uniref:hypothetical protein n=1 Tax=Sulfurimonas sp. NWX367 TaxID=2925413 RepID=UPI003204EA9F